MVVGGTVMGVAAGLVGFTLTGLVEGTVMMVVSPKVLLLWILREILFCFSNDIASPGVDSAYI